MKRFGDRSAKLVARPNLGTWLETKERWGVGRLHRLQKERVGGKAKAKENDWVISNNTTRLCIESWSPMWFYSVVRGG
jgi:hypothetical protein